MDIYYFTDKFEKSEIQSLNKRIHIIYRNYSEDNNELTIKKLVKFCKKNNRKIFISNQVNLALKYNFDGLYIPAFNKLTYSQKFKKKINFKIIGSAHNYQEILIKEKQGCVEIFISPIFFNKKNKTFLDVVKFNNLALTTNRKIIALGGINQNNIKRLLCTKSKGYAGISGIKKPA
jgi:thiamine-phosphate pyrophosphorylase